MLAIFVERVSTMFYITEPIFVFRAGNRLTHEVYANTLYRFGMYIHSGLSFRVMRRIVDKLAVPVNRKYTLASSPAGS